jgi:hypothetical protein
VQCAYVLCCIMTWAGGLNPRYPPVTRGLAFGRRKSTRAAALVRSKDPTSWAEQLEKIVATPRVRTRKSIGRQRESITHRRW